MREIGSRPMYYKIRSPPLYFAIVPYAAGGLQVIKKCFFNTILKIFHFIKSILSWSGPALLLIYGIHIEWIWIRTFNLKFCHMGRGRVYGYLVTIYGGRGRSLNSGKMKKVSNLCQMNKKNSKMLDFLKIRRI